jgi:hypothetical protein
MNTNDANKPIRLPSRDELESACHLSSNDAMNVREFIRQLCTDAGLVDDANKAANEKCPNRHEGVDFLSGKLCPICKGTGLKSNAASEKMTPLPCPFCGMVPTVLPFSAAQGDAWGEVRCENNKCVTLGIRVKDGVGIADGRGSDAYKQAAIKRWNNVIPSCNAVPAQVEEKTTCGGCGESFPLKWLKCDSEGLTVCPDCFIGCMDEELAHRKDLIIAFIKSDKAKVETIREQQQQLAAAREEAQTQHNLANVALGDLQSCQKENEALREEVDGLRKAPGWRGMDV